MKKYILLLISLLFCFEVISNDAAGTISSFERAKLHPLVFNKPAIDFLMVHYWVMVQWEL